MGALPCHRPVSICPSPFPSSTYLSSHFLRTVFGVTRVCVAPLTCCSDSTRSGCKVHSVTWLGGLGQVFRSFVRPSDGQSLRGTVWVEGAPSGPMDDTAPR